MLAPTPCAERGCPHLATYRGKCQTHQPKAWKQTTRKDRLPADWKTRRQIVLKTYKGICHICNRPNADSVDHIIAGDDHSLSNLRPVHDRIEPHCHRYKSSREGVEARAKSDTSLPERGYYRPER